MAEHVGQIVNGFPPGDDRLYELLRRYADALMPWAEETAKRMIDDVNRADLSAWSKATKEMSAALRYELLRTDTGLQQRLLLMEQVDLIRSIPLDAGRRVHDLTLKAIEDSSRASEIAKEIYRTNEVSVGRAKLIARTEVSRTASTLTQARAEHIGSPGYLWKTSRDGDVRQSHREMAGKFVAWDDPPTLDNLTGHAGCLPNCRCYPQPVFD